MLYHTRINEAASFTTQRTEPMTNATTIEAYTKTFADGFTVRITSRGMGTSCNDQAKWFDVDEMVSSMRTLAAHAPTGMIVNELMALAVQQQRAAWLGLQTLTA